jgi:hypothetical protein
LRDELASETSGDRLQQERAEAEDARNTAKDAEAGLRQQAESATNEDARREINRRLDEARAVREEADAEVESNARDTRTNDILRAQSEDSLQEQDRTRGASACDECKQVNRDARFCASVCTDDRGAVEPSTMRVCRADVCEVTTCEGGDCKTKVQRVLTDVLDTMDIPVRGSLTRGAEEEQVFTAMRQPPVQDAKADDKVIYDSSLLGVDARKEAFKSMKLKAGEEMKVMCDEDDECDLCTGADGCQFEEDSLLSVETGTVRLPPTATGSAVRLKMAEGTKLKMQGDQPRGILGELNGEVDLSEFEGKMSMANISGSGKVKVGPKATMLLQGRRGSSENDQKVSHNLAINNTGRAEFAGTVRLSRSMTSTGMVNVTAGAKVIFDGGVELAGEGMESWGDLEIGGEAEDPASGGGGRRLQEGRAPFRAKGPVRSYGKLKVKNAGRVELDSDEDHEFGGDGIAMAEGAELAVRKGRVAITGRIESNGTLAVGGGAKLTVSTPGAKNFVRGAGLTVSAGSKVHVESGEVEFEAPLLSDGLVNISAGSKVRFEKLAAGAHRVRGEGLRLEKGGSVALEKGEELEVAGDLISDGALELSGTMRLTKAGGCSQIGGLGAVLQADAEIAVEGGTLEVKAPLVSAGRLRAGAGAELRFDRPNGTVVLGGRGLRVEAGGRVDLTDAVVGASHVESDGDLALHGKSTLQFVGSFDRGNASSIRGGVEIGNESKAEFALGITRLRKMKCHGSVVIGALGQLDVEAGSSEDPEELEFGGDGVILEGSLFIGDDAEEASGSGRRLQGSPGGPRVKVTVTGKKGLKAKSSGALRIRGGSTLELASGVEAENELGGLGLQVDATSELRVKPAARVKFTSDAEVEGKLRAEPGSHVTIEGTREKPTRVADLELEGRLEVKTGALKLKKVECPAGAELVVGVDAEATFEADDVAGAGRRLQSAAERVLHGRVETKGQMNVDARVRIKDAEGLTSRDCGRVHVRTGGELSFEQAAGEVSELAGNTTADGPVRLKGAGTLRLSKSAKGGRHEFTGAEGIVGDSVDAILEVDGGDVIVTGKLDQKGPLKLKGGGKMKLEAAPGVAHEVGDLDVEEGSEIELAGGDATLTGRLESRGKVDISKGTVRVQECAPHCPRVFRGEGLTVSDGAKLELLDGATAVTGRLAAAGEVELAAGAALQVGTADATLQRLTSAGNIVLEADGEAAEGSGRRRLETISGSMVIGDGGLQSTGHITVPAGASLAFDGAGSSSIGGTGMASAGTIEIRKGEVSIDGGGLQSDGAVIVRGTGGLVFDSPEPSMLAGSGLTADAGAAVTIRQATVDFRAPLQGVGAATALVVEGEATITFSEGAGQACPVGLDRCQDNVAAKKVACVGQWGEWGACSIGCGGGYRTRSFEVIIQAKDGGAACAAVHGDTSEEQCNTVACSGAVDTGMGADVKPPRSGGEIKIDSSRGMLASLSWRVAALTFAALAISAA